MTTYQNHTGLTFPLRLTSECPYCGWCNTNVISTAPDVVICDNDEGGCDKRYVVSVPFSIAVVVTALKIEGE